MQRGAAPSPSSWHWLKDEVVYSVVLFLKVWVTPPITLQLPTHPLLFNLLSTAPDPPSSLPLEQTFSSHIHFYWPEPGWNLQLPTAIPSKVPPAAVKIGALSTPAPNYLSPGLAKRSQLPLAIVCKEGVPLLGLFFPSLSLYIYILLFSGEGGTGFCFVFTAAIQSPGYWFSGTWKGFFTGLPCGREQQ